MSGTIIITGGGRATLRRLDAKQNDPAYAVGTAFTADRAALYNAKLADLDKMCDEDDCPEDPCPE